MLDQAIELYNEGICYYSGDEGYPLNYAKAFELFSKAAEQGLGPAMNYLGLMYEDGIGVGEDLEKAFEWYQRGMEAEDALAVYNIGRWYLEGIGVEANSDVAMQYFEKSLQIEETPNAAYCYGCGCLERNDLGKALELFEYSAESTDMPEAWHNLAWTILQGGSGYEAESVNAARAAAPYYLKAAQQGYAPSMDEYGRLLIRLQGVGNEARQWIKAAADAGYEPAQKRLKTLSVWNFLDRL